MSIQIEKDQCTGCGNCLAYCLRGLLQLSAAADCNARGVRYAQLTDAARCVGCGLCEQACTAAAMHLPGRQNGYALLDKQHIPPHSGCYLGSLAKALADAICELGVQARVVLFKKKAADVNLLVESHDYTTEDFYADGLAYKTAHPEKLVVIICSSSKVHSTALNESRFKALTDESITFINTLNWFESDPTITTLTGGESHIAEYMSQHSAASFVARSSVRNTTELIQLRQYVRRGLQNQMEGKPFSLIEMTFPCFYRLSGRPQTLMPYEALTPVNQWFDRNVKPLYPEGVLKEVND